MKNSELISWFRKKENSNKTDFEQLCYEITKLILTRDQPSSDFNQYLGLLISHCESLYLNRTNLLFTWFSDLSINLDRLLRDSLETTISANIKINTVLLTSLIQVAPHDKFLFYLGYVYFQERQNRDSILNLKKIKNKDAKAWGILGQNYLELGLFNEAIECLEFATYMNNKDLHGLFLLSQSYLENGDNKMAIFYLSKCWQICPKNPEIAFLYSIACTNMKSPEYFRTAKGLIMEAQSNDHPELIASGIMMGVKMKDKDFIDLLIDKIKPSDLKSPSFLKILSELLIEINKSGFAEQQINLLSQLTNYNYK